MRAVALIKRILRQMLRDKRTLALLFVAPLLILTLMHYMFNSNAVTPKLGIANGSPWMESALQQSGIEVYSYAQADEHTMIEEQLDGLIRIDSGSWELILLNEDPSLSKALQMKVAQALSSIAKSPAEPGVIAAAPELEIRYIYGNEETAFFDVLSPVLVGYFVFFFVFLIAGIGLLRERTTGTLERLMSTPIRRSEIILGYLAGYGILAVVQTIIVVGYSITVLDIVLAGSFWHVLIINLLLALVALSLGILLSAFAASEFQMMQFIPLVIIPQIFFAGIFPLEGMAQWLQALGYMMPIYYASNALKAVMYQGQGLGDIGLELLALALFGAVFVLLNVLALKRYRKL